jgi:glycogen(starch) synthase
MRVENVLMTVDTVGGVWSYAVELATALPDVRFTFATMGAPVSESQRRSTEGLENVTLRESRFPLEWMDEPWSDVDRAGEWLLEIAHELRPDLIHLNGYSHATLPFDAAVLVVAHSCVLSWWRAVKDEPAPAAYNEYRRRVAAGLNAAALVAAPTAAMLDSLRETYDAVFTGLVIHNARSHTEFRPLAKQPTIFSAGRVWDEAKNIALLNDIAARVRWPIAIAGDAAHPSGNVVALPNVRLLGRLADTDLARRFGEAAIYAAPAFYEPFGLSILEAALSSCALVLSDIPTLRELWSDAAVFASPRDPAGFIRAFDALITNAVKREEMGLRARERALHFTTERFAAGYRDAYRRCVARTEVPA